MVITNSTVAFVTGASSGIGRALALALAQRGAAVALIARRRERLNDTAAAVEEAGGRALAIACDVADRTSVGGAVAATIERFGRLDLLVNNAGGGHMGFVEDTSQEEIERVFALNVFSLWYASAPAITQMRNQGSGAILTIGSIAGKMGYPGNAAYVAAKHAAVGFTRALRTELAGTGIDASIAIPAGTLTEWAATIEDGAMLRLFEYEGRRGREIAREQGMDAYPPLPLLSPEDVAERILTGLESGLPEIYTHPDSRERIREYEERQIDAEARLEPYWIANREGYQRIRAEQKP
ncbi:MAG TPA: SDR family oxidoreductase [Candidatus Kapabacteria bacterium]|nr:SDR family oxidoreductase [Candidatus Kapabacteria bacterium]